MDNAAIRVIAELAGPGPVELVERATIIFKDICELQ